MKILVRLVGPLILFAASTASESSELLDLCEELNCRHEIITNVVPNDMLPLGNEQEQVTKLAVNLICEESDELCSILTSYRYISTTPEIIQSFQDRPCQSTVPHHDGLPSFLVGRPNQSLSEMIHCLAETPQFLQATIKGGACRPEYRDAMFNSKVIGGKIVEYVEAKLGKDNPEFNTFKLEMESWFTTHDNNISRFDINC